MLPWLWLRMRWRRLLISEEIFLRDGEAQRQAGHLSQKLAARETYAADCVAAGAFSSLLVERSQPVFPRRGACALLNYTGCLSY